MVVEPSWRIRIHGTHLILIFPRIQAYRTTTMNVDSLKASRLPFTIPRISLETIGITSLHSTSIHVWYIPNHRYRRSRQKSRNTQLRSGDAIWRMNVHLSLSRYARRVTAKPTIRCKNVDVSHTTYIERLHTSQLDRTSGKRVTGIFQSSWEKRKRVD